MTPYNFIWNGCIVMTFPTEKYGKANLCRLMAELHKQGKTLDVNSAMAPICNTPGSRFGEDVIRITGSDEFCLAVLSRISDMIQIERRDTTRLDASWQEIKDQDGRFKKGQGMNSIYLRKASRSTGNSPMAQAHQMSRFEF